MLSPLYRWSSEAKKWRKSQAACQEPGLMTGLEPFVTVPGQGGEGETIPALAGILERSVDPTFNHNFPEMLNLHS